MNCFIVFQELRVPRQTYLACVTRENCFLCLFSWAKRDITLAVWNRVFVYYMNKSYACEQEVCKLVWKCTQVCVREGKSACSKQLQPCAFKCLRQNCFQQKHCEFHPQDFLFYFWNLLLNSLQPHWFVWGIELYCWLVLFVPLLLECSVITRVMVGHLGVL